MQKEQVEYIPLEIIQNKMSNAQMAVKVAFQTYYKLLNRLENLKVQYPHVFMKLINKKSYHFYTDPNGLMLITNTLKEYYCPQLRDPAEVIQTQELDWSSFEKDYHQNRSVKLIPNKSHTQPQQQQNQLDVNESFWKIISRSNFQFNSKQQQIKVEQLRKEINGKSQKQQTPDNHPSNSIKIFKRGPYKSYTIQEKKYAVALLNQGIPITRISADLKIPCKNIKRWAEQGVYRKIGAGRKRMNPQLEEQVCIWIHDNFSLGSTIDIELIQQKALLMSTDKQFKASRGWIINFIQRFKLNRTYTFS